MKRNFVSKILAASLIMIISISMVACGNSTKPAIAHDRNGKWVNDITYLEEQLPKRHKNLFFKVKKEDFYRDMNELKNKVNDYSDEEIKVQLSKIIASIGDGHTMVYPNIETIYPLKFYWFKEGIYVVDAPEEYKNTLNLKLDKINGKNISEVLELLKPIISHENSPQFKNLAGIYLTMPEILKGLNIINEDEVNMIFLDEKGKEIEVDIKPDKVENIKYIGKMVEDNNNLLYLRNPYINYWYEYIKEDNTLYFQYNSCSDMKEKPFKQFAKEMFDFIDKNNVEKLVIDLRHNGGGNSSIMNPFFEELEKREELNDKDKLYVVVGRKTFSSAILNALTFKNKTQATFIGEPTGGKPNHYGEVKELYLDNTGITVSYSVKYFKNSKEDTDSLMPDINVEPSIIDYINKKDAVIEKILN
ncbi:peptidase S41 [Clostridium sp. MSJ-11]|uniref:Peptidase S41 n=1 Tax=Clostridium mobile TaxID=2841512 RepID=A0ABS6EEQ3_9CLOT|nr:S41 family peptidase [Clostridium mobile]MBU5483693.1 peptidase S41 [Clostridium mobile]